MPPEPRTKVTGAPADGIATLSPMDGLTRSVGDGITGLVAGSLAWIGAALGGMARTLEAVLPAGSFPVLAIALLLLFAWAVVRR